MSFRKAIAAMVLSAAVVSVSTTAAHAATPHTGLSARVHSIFSRGPRMVSFQLRNDSRQAMQFRAGTELIDLAPGKTTAVKLAPGEKIVAAQPTSSLATGEVAIVVTDALKDATVAMK